MAKIGNKILKQRTLNELVETLKEHNKDSCEYLDEFYNQCKNKEIDDLDWVENNNDFMDFIGNQEIEYNRIYDIAVLNITNQLLEILDIKTKR
jgi:hypothetical protein